MGQYYVPVIISRDRVVRTLSSHDFDNGLKLMEHSYIGNVFVNAVLAIIKNTPSRLAWIGDYSNDPYEGPYAKLPKGEFDEYFNAAWSERGSCKMDPSAFEGIQLDKVLDIDTADRYLVNHTHECYINVSEYIHNNQWKEKGLYINRVYDENAESTWCINPLPLLTACGNGRGGGDYHDCYPDYGLVGTWAFDLIEYTSKCPSEYNPVMYTFSEQKKTNQFSSEEAV